MWIPPFTAPTPVQNFAPMISWLIVLSSVVSSTCPRPGMIWLIDAPLANTAFTPFDNAPGLFDDSVNHNSRATGIVALPLVALASHSPPISLYAA